MTPRVTALAGLFLSTALFAQVDVLTAQYNNSRTGANLRETTLNTSNVAPATFGKLFSRSVEGEVYAYPLLVSNVKIPNKGTHNVVYVAAASNNVYAFDADDPAQSAPLWSRNLGPAINFGDNEGDVHPYWGILGTPVIQDGVLYLATVISKDTEHWPMYLCALDITTGLDKYGPPAEIKFPNAGTLTSGTPFTIQRAALLAANRTIYVAFSNFMGEITNHPQATGFVFAYAQNNITKPTALFQPAKQQGSCGNGIVWRGGNIWQAGRGLVADDNGTVMVSTANGFYDGVSNFGDSLLALTPDLKLKDWFTPSDWQTLCQGDLDLGSSGPMLLPGTTGYVVAIGKEGVLYLLNKNRLGHLQTKTSPPPVAEFLASGGCHRNNCSQTPSLAYWEHSPNNMLYLWDTQDVLRAYTFNAGRLMITPTSLGTNSYNYIGGVSISSNRNVAGTGILWAITSTNTTEGTPAPGVLHAYDALNINHELWNSDMNAARDAMGNFTKFSIPVVANGKAYVITESNQLQVYGVLGAR